MKLKPKLWEQVTSLFEAALEQKPEDRGHFLDGVCSDPEIRKEVVRLLANHDGMGSFLSKDGLNFRPLSADSQAPPAFLDGQLLAGRFKVVGIIARGGMGEVYTALDVEEETLIAIKTIRADLLNADLLQRFRQEVQLAKRVTHPNICRVYDLFRHSSGGGESVFFISMELLQGETLARKLHHAAKLSTNEALPLTLQIAAALGAAHDAGILHRDLKPENVMLVPQECGVRAVVMDFGVALPAGSPFERIQSATLTGTPAYMSPEQLEGRDLTPASDIYALGLVMYRMVTGSNAFEGMLTASDPYRRLTDVPKPPRELIPEIDRRWEIAILKCMERDPSRRFPSARSLADALSPAEALAGGLRTKKLVSRRTVWIALCAAALMIAAISLFYWKTRLRADDDLAFNVARHPLLVSGLRMLESGDAVAARQILEREVVAEPQFGPAHSVLSSALLSLGYETRGREEARKAEGLLPGLPPEDAFLVKGQYYESAFDWQRALKSFEALHALAPEEPEWTLRYSLALSKIGKQKEAFEVIEKLKASQRAPEFALRIGLAEASVAESANDYPRERRVAELVETSAKSKGLLYQAGRAELSEGWALENLGEFKEAESKVSAAKSLLSRIGDKGGEGQAWKLLGDVYADQNRLELAKSAYQQAMLVFTGIGWQSGHAIALNNCGYVLRSLGDLQGARAYFEQSLSISRALGNLKIQALALTGTAVVLKRMGNFGGAEQAYSAAIEIEQRLSNEGSLATVMNNFAAVLQDEGKLAEAQTNFDRAMELFRKLGRQGDVAMVLGNLGDLAIRNGNLVSAEKYYGADVKLGKSIPQPDNLGYAFLGLGEVCFLRANMKRARYYLDKSLKIREGLHEAGNVAETSLALAEIDLEEKTFAAAATRARNASHEFAVERQVDQEAVAQAILGESLAGEQKLNQALLAADSALRLLDASEDRDSQMTAKLHLWKVFERVGRIADAVRLLQSVFEDATKYGYVPQMLEAQLFMAQLQAKPAEMEPELAQIRAEAATKELFLISRKASTQVK